MSAETLAADRGGLPFARDGLGGGAATPLYLRLQEAIKGAIASGSLKPLDALPGEREIAQTLSISSVTVRKALSGLVGAGLLEQRQGSGTYVARRVPSLEQPLSRLTSFTEDMRRRGLSTTSRWLDRTVSMASTREAIHLALSPQDSVSRLSRLRFADGLLEQRQGSGTYVARPVPSLEQPLSRLTSFTEDMRRRGLSTTSHWLDRTVSMASTREAIHLALSPQDSVSRLSRLRFADGLPMAIERAAIPLRYLDDPGTVVTSLYDALDARGFKPVRALQRLAAANLAREDAQMLEVPVGSAALSIERVAYLAGGQPVEFTRSFYRGDIYDFVAELTLG